MKRRSFLKSSAIAGAALGSLSTMKSCDQPESIQQPEFFQNLPERTAVKNLENEFLSVHIFSDASLSVKDKKNGKNWETFRVALQDKGTVEETNVWMRGDRTLMEQYPAHFVLEEAGQKFRVTMLTNLNKVQGKFYCTIALENEWLRVEMLDIDEKIPSLMFPAPIVSDKILFPQHSGHMMHRDTANIWYRQFLPFHTHLNMNWIGGLKDGGAWIGVFEDDAVDGGALIVNSSINPGWLKSLGKWSGKYAIRYKFLQGDYVDVAKTYRKYLIDNGKFKSLKEKVEQNPKLKNMQGGRTLSYFQAWPAIDENQGDKYYFTDQQLKKWNTKGTVVDFTHNDVVKSVKYAQSKGFKNGLVILRGWINGGYDASHPDIWPPEPALGSLDALKELLNLPEPIVTGLHDNYQDMYEGYPSFPKGINLNKNGDFMNGGFWAGGQAYILNSRNSVEYAKRNWAHMQMLGSDAIFSDTAAASKLEQSYEPGNTLTKLQDYKLKRELLSVFSNAGQLAGSEEGSAFLADICDWFENRHVRIPGETVPLWSLVFHDSNFVSRYTSFEPGNPYPKWLEDMLWGYQLQFFMDPAFGGVNTKKRSQTVGFGANQMTEELFASTFHVDKWHAKIGMAEMTRHEFLTEDNNVESTEWSTGEKIIVNFGNLPFTVNGTIIAAKDFKILT
jgi:hypothetical protein